VIVNFTGCAVKVVATTAQSIVAALCASAVGRAARAREYHRLKVTRIIDIRDDALACVVANTVLKRLSANLILRHEATNGRATLTAIVAERVFQRLVLAYQHLLRTEAGIDRHSSANTGTRRARVACVIADNPLPHIVGKAARRQKASETRIEGAFAVADNRTGRRDFGAA
jgi:hypothetical protein